MAQFEITDFPEIATLTDEENFVFYVKRVTDGQDYKIKLKNIQGLITDTVVGQGDDFIQSIVDQLLPQIESTFEQDLEDQVSEAIASERVQQEIELKINEILGKDFENPYTTIIAEVNSVIDNAATNKFFNKQIGTVENAIRSINEVAVPNVQKQIDNLNTETLPELELSLATLGQELDTLNSVTLVELRNDLATLEGNVQDLGGVDVTQLQNDLQLVEDNLATLNNITLPDLRNDLDGLDVRLSDVEGLDVSSIQSDLDNLNNVVIPNLDSTLSTLTSVTLPQVEADLAENEIALQELKEDLANVSENNETAYIVGIVNGILDNKVSNIDSKKTINIVQRDLEELNKETLELVNTRINQVNTDLGELNSVTLPSLQQSIGEANLELQQLESLFPIQSVSIADNAIQAGKIAANAVLASNIVSGAITTDKMVANSINGDRIAANTLSADKIIANSITGDRLQANSITGDKIQANTISGDRLVANTITSDLVASDTILTRHLVLTDLSNLLDGSGFDTDNIPWGFLPNGAVLSTVGGESVLQLSNPYNNTITYEGSLSVKEGERLYFEAVTRKTSNFSGSISLRIEDKNGIIKTVSIVPSSSDSFIKTVDEFTFNTSSNITVKVLGNVSSGSLYIDNLYLKRMQNAELIVDGAITTDKMTANSINGDRIKTNTLNANRIVSNSITAGQIAGQTITGSLIAGQTITGNLVAATTLTGDKLVANTITGDKIAANTIFAKNLKVADFENRVLNPKFEDNEGNLDTAGWVGLSTTLPLNVSDWGASYGGVIQSGEAYYESFPCSEGEIYRTEVSVFKRSGTNGQLRLGYRLERSNGTFFTSYDPDVDSERVDVYLSSQDGILTLVSHLEIPNDVVKATPILVTTASSGNGYTFTNVYTRRLMNGELIVDGTLSARKIVAQSITGDLIAGETISGDLLSGNTITGDKIAGNTITGENIAARSLTSKQVVIANTDNLVTNSSFEVDGSADNFDWTPSLNTVNVSSDTGFKGAKYGLVLPQNTITTALTPFDIISEQKFNGRILVKATAGTSKVYFGLLLEKANGQTVFINSLVYDAALDSGVKESSFTIEIPEGQGYIKAYPRLNNVGNSAITFAQPYIRLMGDGRLIVDGTIEGTKIVAETISGDKIAGNTISGDKIIANTIGADKIVSFSIGADQIAAKSIGTDQLVSNSVTSDIVAANAISAKNLLVADLSNLIDGSNFEDLDNILWSLSSFSALDTTVKYEGTRSLKVTPSTSAYRTVTYDAQYDVEDGDTLLLTMASRRSGTTTQPIKFVIRRANDNGYLTAVDLSGPSSPNNTWEYITKDLVVNYTGKVKFSLEVAQSSGVYNVDRGVLRRKYKGNLIVDGAITASKIDAEAVETDAIKAGAIVAEKIASETITGDLIAADTITTKNLVISDFENLTYGSDFEVLEEVPWDGINGTASIQTSSAAPVLQKALRITAGTGGTKQVTLNYNPELKKGEELFLEYDLFTSGSYNGGGGNAKLRFGDALNNNTFIAADDFVVTNSTWSERTFSYRYTGDPTRITVSIWTNHTQGELWITNIRLRRKRAGNLIVDGTITATQIAAEAIDATKLSADAIDGKIITGSLLRTSGRTDIPRVVIGGDYVDANGNTVTAEFPLWYGTGSISTQNMAFGLLSDGTAYAQNLVIENNSVFKGTLNGASGTFGTITSGNITGTTISGNTITGGTISGTTITGTTITGGSVTGATVTGGLIRTADSGYRTELDSGTYMIWSGTSTKNDANAVFYVKKDGTGFIKGEFFQGEINESKFASSTSKVATAVGHQSKGYDVGLTGTFSYVRNYQTTAAPIGGISFAWRFRRGSTVVDSGTTAGTVTVVEELGTYYVSEVGSFTIDSQDTSNGAGTFSYTFEITSNLNSNATLRTTVRTNENLTG